MNFFLFKRDILKKIWYLRFLNIQILMTKEGFFLNKNSFIQTFFMLTSPRSTFCILSNSTHDNNFLSRFLKAEIGNMYIAYIAKRKKEIKKQTIQNTLLKCSQKNNCRTEIWTVVLPVQVMRKRCVLVLSTTSEAG